MHALSTSDLYGLIMFQMLKSLQLPPITDTIACRRLGLFSHVARMNNGITADDALDCAITHRTEIWKRPPGHPHRV